MALWVLVAALAVVAIFAVLDFLSNCKRLGQR